MGRNKFLLMKPVRIVKLVFVMQEQILQALLAIFIFYNKMIVQVSKCGGLEISGVKSDKFNTQINV